jgi:hypothetical protein
MGIVGNGSDGSLQRCLFNVEGESTLSAATPEPVPAPSGREVVNLGCFLLIEPQPLAHPREIGPVCLGLVV